MPTYEYPEAFFREFRRLPVEQQRRFRAAVAELVTALGQRPPMFPGRLRVKRVQGHLGADLCPGRARDVSLRRRGDAGLAHVIWRRVGDHSILRSP